MMNLSFDFDAPVPAPVKPKTSKSLTSRVKGQSLTSQEYKVLNDISQECLRLLDINGLSTSHQVNAMYSGIVGVEAVMSADWNAMLQIAVMGIQACDEVQGVSAYIFQNLDGANRNLASPQRIALKQMAIRLNLAERTQSSLEIDTAMCLRAMICASLTAERGLIHLTKENFAAVIRTVHREGSELSKLVTWTDELKNYGQRFANARVRMP